MTTSLKKLNLIYDKITSISIDGAPAMMAKEKKFLKKIRNNNSKILIYQCIIHKHRFVVNSIIIK